MIAKIAHAAILMAARFAYDPISARSLVNLISGQIANGS